MKMTNTERVALLTANGWPAAYHPEHGLVVRYMGRVWRVAGGEFKAPSLLCILTLRPRDITWKEPEG